MRGLRPLDDPTPAQWLVDAVSTFTGRVGELMPHGFEAYLRIFHRPDQGRPDEASASSWAQVAERHGTVLHPEAQWRALTGGRVDSPHSADPAASSDQPLLGSLDPLTLPRLARHLSRLTTTPGRCYVALWEGLGLAPPSWHDRPTFGLLSRRYWLFAPAPVEAVTEVAVQFEVQAQEEELARTGRLSNLLDLSLRGERQSTAEDDAAWLAWQRAEGFVQSPTWWWPEDRVWVVYSEADYDSTLVAGPRTVLTALLDDSDIECLEVSQSTCLFSDADTVNRA